MSNPVVFDYGVWVARYPEFSAVSQPLAKAFFEDAGDFFANSGWTAGLPQAARLLNMLTAHLAWLYAPRDAAGNPSSTGTMPAPLVGRISTASEGSVSVSTELTGSGSPSEAWFTQTRYGFQFWAATAQFRTARYVPKPTIVPSGVFPYRRW